MEYQCLLNTLKKVIDLIRDTVTMDNFHDNVIRVCNLQTSAEHGGVTNYSAGVATASASPPGQDRVVNQVSMAACIHFERRLRNSIRISIENTLPCDLNDLTPAIMADWAGFENPLMENDLFITSVFTGSVVSGGDVPDRRCLPCSSH